MKDQLSLESNTMISIEDIIDASVRVAEIATKTPFQLHKNLSDKYDCKIFLKREDMQVVRSFKIRGAYNKIRLLDSEIAKKGIVCASAGNHAQGVALSCANLGIHGTIYMPNPTPKQKVSKVKFFGKEYIDIVLTGDSFDDAYLVAKEAASVQGKSFVHPFDDKDVIAGQGSIGVEMMQQVSQTLDVLLVAVGGGGLISGVGSYFKQLSPSTKIIAVECAGAPTLSVSLDKGTIQTLRHIDTFADGIAVKRVGQLTFDICKSVVDQCVVVEEGKVCSTILKLYNDEAIVVEPAGAVAIAALDQLKEEIRGKRIGVIVCGGNNDVNRTQEITERALLYEGKKHYFIIRFPQRAGALRKFLEVLGPNDDIAHFQYTKKNNRENGPAMVGIELGDAKDYDALISRMVKMQINFEEINKNPTLFEMLV